MKRLHYAVLLPIVLTPALCAAPVERRVPNLHLFPTPFEEGRVPLTKALGEIGVRVQNGFVLFGVEMREKEGREPDVDLKLPEGATLNDAVRDVLRQVPGYTLQVVSEHMINIYPQGAKDDPRDPLNLRVEKFDFVEGRLGTLLRYPNAYILELRERLAERKEGPPYPIAYPTEMVVGTLEPVETLHLRNVTMRDILNRASEATLGYPAHLSPYCWSAMLHPDPAWAVGGTYSWGAFGCTPTDWKRYWKQEPAAAKTD